VRNKWLVKAGSTCATMPMQPACCAPDGHLLLSSVENFASDALAFATFGLNGQLNPMTSTNCDQTAKCGATRLASCMASVICLLFLLHADYGPTDW